MKISENFTFGHYAGETIHDVWVGKSFDWEQTNNIQNTFIQEMVDYITQKDGATVVPLDIDDYPSLEKDLKKIKGLKLRLVDNLIINPKDQISIVETLRNLLMKIFKQDLIHFHKNFFQLKVRFKEGYREGIYSENTHKLFSMLPNPYYIYWAIKNVDEFKLDTEELHKLKSLPVQYLSTFKFRPVYSNIIQIVPVFKALEVQDFDDILELNEKKQVKSRSKKQFNSYGKRWYEDNYRDPNARDHYCDMCHQRPCMCSDPN